METEQETLEGTPKEEVTYEENIQKQEDGPETYAVTEESTNQQQEETSQKNNKLNNQGEDRSSFIHGLAVGLGIGCICTFVIVWIAIFFTPQLASAVTYEGLLSIFIYPLIYLLAVGLIALTAGIVREYYSLRRKL